MSTKIIELAKNILLAIVFSFIFLFVVNYLAGIFFDKEISRVQWVQDHTVRLRMSDNPEIMFEIAPNIGEANSRGLRDFEYGFKKPRGTYRIAVIGDSISYGIGVEIEEPWPKQLERKLNENNAAIKFEVINFSVPAYSTLQEAEVLRTKAVKYDPDFVIMAAFVNDNTIYSSEMNKIFSREVSPDYFDSEQVLFDPSLSDFQRFIYGSNLGRIVRYRIASLNDSGLDGAGFLRRLWPGKRVRYISEYYNDIDVIALGFEKISLTVKQHRLPALVVFFSHEENAAVRDKISRICREKGMDFMDTMHLFPYKKEDTRGIYYIDNCHLTPYAHALYADEVYLKLESMGIAG